MCNITIVIIIIDIVIVCMYVIYFVEHRYHAVCNKTLFNTFFDIT